MSNENQYYVCPTFEIAKDILLSILKNKPESLAIDLETTSLDEHSGKILGFGFSWKIHTGVYIPLNIREIGLFVSDLSARWEPEQEAELINLICQILSDPDILIVAHNAAFELRWLNTQWDVKPPKIFCTLWYKFIQHPDTSKGYEEKLGLGYIVQERYPDLYHLKDIWDGIKSKPKAERDLSLYHPTEKIGTYCCGDCDAALRLYEEDKIDIVGKPFETLVPNRLMPAVQLVSRISNVGFPVDIDYLQRTREDLKKEQRSVLLEVQELAKSVRFNPQSTQHLSDFFIRQLKMPKNETQVFDQRSKRMIKKLVFDDQTLTNYQERHGCRAAGLVSEYRRISKLIATYFDGVEAVINPVTGRVHPDLLLWGTVTGRLSCRDPNLQNLPVRDARSRIVKNMFVAPEGYVIIGADYSQIELRLLAFYSQDPLLLKAYREEIDVHSLTASIIFGIELESVTKDQRYLGKTANFALCYGGKAGVLVFGLTGIGNKIMGPEYAAKLGVPYDKLSTVKIDQEVLMRRAREIRTKYFAGYSQLKPYAQSVVEQVRKDEFVVSDYGRIRYTPGINHKDEKYREHWERCAVNTRPQSTASDYLMFHFHDMIDEFDARGWGVDPALMVHDQCVMFVPEDKADLVVEQIPILGTRVDEANIGIPMKLEPAVGRHLGEV